MCCRLAETGSTVDNVKLSLAKYPPAHQSKNLAELALFILTEAKVTPNKSLQPTPTARFAAGERG
jgi:hypothetical protein